MIIVCINYTETIILRYRILPVNSHGYYKFQVEIGATTNQDVYIEIAGRV